MQVDVHHKVVVPRASQSLIYAKHENGGHEVPPVPPFAVSRVVTNTEACAAPAR